MTTFPLRLTEELKAAATAQAARAGVSLNQHIATLLAVHVGAQAEAALNPSDPRSCVPKWPLRSFGKASSEPDRKSRDVGNQVSNGCICPRCR
jgi:hypothetical protein